MCLLPSACPTVEAKTKYVHDLDVLGLQNLEVLPRAAWIRLRFVDLSFVREDEPPGAKANGDHAHQTDK